MALGNPEEHGHHDLPQGEVVAYALIVVALILGAGLMSGLTLGLLSLDEMDLRVIQGSGTARQRAAASRLLPILRNPHWLLCTLLLANASCMEALPLFLDRLLDPLAAILLSVTAILVMGEIVPQAICSRHGVAIGAALAPLVRVLMWATCIITWPLGKLLDLILGHGDVALKRAELKAMVQLHAEGAGLGGRLTEEEVSVIQGALDLKHKTALSAMTTMDKVFMVSDTAVFDRALVTRLLESGHSRVPVYRGSDQSNIIGLILVKELISHLGEKEAPRVDQLALRPLPRLPADTPMFDALRLFQTGNSHMLLLMAPEGTDMLEFKLRRAWINSQDEDTLSPRTAAAAAAADADAQAGDTSTNGGAEAGTSGGGGREGGAADGSGFEKKKKKAGKHVGWVAGLRRLGSTAEGSLTDGGSSTTGAAAAAAATAATMAGGEAPAAASSSSGRKRDRLLAPIRTRGRQEASAGAAAAGDNSSSGPGHIALQVMEPGTRPANGGGVVSAQSSGLGAVVSAQSSAGAASWAATSERESPARRAQMWFGFSPVGIITLEDVLEELMQTEFVDETDRYQDNEKTVEVDVIDMLESLPPHLRSLARTEMLQAATRFLVRKASLGRAAAASAALSPMSVATRAAATTSATAAAAAAATAAAATAAAAAAAAAAPGGSSPSGVASRTASGLRDLARISGTSGRSFKSVPNSGPSALRPSRMSEPGPARHE